MEPIALNPISIIAQLAGSGIAASVATENVPAYDPLPPLVPLIPSVWTPGEIAKYTSVYTLAFKCSRN